jgi:hypothetical protein
VPLKTRKLLKQPRRRFAFDQRQNFDDATAGLNGPAFLLVNRSERIISAFDPDIRFRPDEEIQRRTLSKNANRIDTLKSGDDCGAVVFVVYGAAGPFEVPDRSVAIDADEEDVALLAGVLKVSDMAKMQDIEAAVGHDELAPLRADFGAPGRQIFPRQNFVAKTHVASND